MIKRVSFHELAEMELNDASIFFESKREGLGLRFLVAMEAVVTHIQEHPQASPVIINDIRRKVLRRFPYSIFYSIKPDRIESWQSPGKGAGHSIGMVAIDTIA